MIIEKYLPPTYILLGQGGDSVEVETLHVLVSLKSWSASVPFGFILIAAQHPPCPSCCPRSVLCYSLILDNPELKCGWVRLSTLLKTECFS